MIDACSIPVYTYDNAYGLPVDSKHKAHTHRHRHTRQQNVATTEPKLAISSDAPLVIHNNVCGNLSRRNSDNTISFTDQSKRPAQPISNPQLPHRHRACNIGEDAKLSTNSLGKQDDIADTSSSVVMASLSPEVCS